MSGSCCEPPPAQWLDTYGVGVRPRRHGFECPLDEFQVLAWVTIFVLVVSYFMLHLPFLPGDAQIALTVVITCLAVVTVSLKITTSLAENEDSAVFADEPRLDLATLSNAPPAGTEACYYCRRFVSLGSKHCSVCDKCVKGFDHHCRWLNACVGSRTYHLFFSFVTSAVLSIVLVTAVGIYVIVDALRYKAKYVALLESKYLHASYDAYIFFLFLFAAYGCLAAIAIGNLLVFHVYLIITKQTTYAWILAKRESKLRAGGARSRPTDSGCCPEHKRRVFKKKTELAPMPGSVTHEPANALPNEPSLATASI